MCLPIFPVICFVSTCLELGNHHALACRLPNLESDLPNTAGRVSEGVPRARTPSPDTSAPEIQ